MKTVGQTETYQQLKKLHSKELEDFPIKFAFSEEQFKQALNDLNAKKEDCCSIGGGGIIQKKDAPALRAMFERHNQEYIKAFKNDDVLIEAIVYELGNHEYGYTGCPDDAIEALGIDLKDPRIKACFDKARSQYLEDNKDNF